MQGEMINLLYTVHHKDAVIKRLKIDKVRLVFMIDVCFKHQISSHTFKLDKSYLLTSQSIPDNLDLKYQNYLFVM